MSTPTHEAPFLAPHEAGRDYLLVRYPNGGWAVEHRSEMGMHTTPLGAFSDAADMLRALADALCVREQNIPDGDAND